MVLGASWWMYCPTTSVTLVKGKVLIPESLMLSESGSRRREEEEQIVLTQCK